MASSYVRYSGDGATLNWAVPFPYLDPSHVHVYVGGVEVTTGISWPTSGTIAVSPAIASGSSNILIQRQTPDTALVNFQNRNNLTADNLSTAALQAVYRAVEAADRADQSIAANATGNYDVGGHRVVNSADPVDPQDLVTRHWAETTMTSTLAQAEAARDTANADVAEINAIYLGKKTADPTVDNNGNPLAIGCFYFNTVSNLVRMYGNTGWVDAVGAVQSFNNRSGAVVPASGDYTAAQVTNTPSGNVSSTTVQTAINELDNEKVPTSRTVSVGGIATGGGDLSADRTITVPKATDADATAGSDDTKAITPHSWKTAWNALLGQMLHVRDERASGTSGTVWTASTWTAQILQTVKVNGITGASLASNQITLPAGKYRVMARAKAYCNGSQASIKSQTRLRDVTNGVTLQIAMGATYGAAGSVNDGFDSTSIIDGDFTLTGTTVLELQGYQAGGTNPPAISTGENEVYADVRIWKID